MAWERKVRITTPESVPLQLEVAGPGQRALALLLDLFLVGILIYMVSLMISIVLPLLVETGPYGQVATSVIIATYLFAVMGILLFYWAVSEALMNGQTLGKRACGLRVVMRGGYPVTSGASFIRNLVRLADMLPPPLFFVGLVSMIASKEYRRLGDIAAGTLVIRDRAPRIPSSGVYLARLRPEQVVRWDTSAISSGDAERIRRFLARRFALRGAARYSVGNRLAARFRPVVSGADPNLPPEVFLEGVVLSREVRASRVTSPEHQFAMTGY